VTVTVTAVLSGEKVTEKAFTVITVTVTVTVTVIVGRWSVTGKKKRLFFQNFFPLLGVSKISIF
jgi:hypothetical protein